MVLKDRATKEGGGVDRRGKKYWLTLQNYQVVSDIFPLTEQLLIFPCVNTVRLISGLSLKRDECGGMSRTDCHGERGNGLCHKGTYSASRGLAGGWPTKKAPDHLLHVS